MSKLLIAGCSNAAGFEIYPGEQQDSSENRHASFGNLLAQHMEAEPVNIAVGGATNSSIARSIMAYVAEHSIKDLHVLCAWTDADRLDAPWTWQVNHKWTNPAVDWYKDEFMDFNHINVGWKGNVENGEAEQLPPYHEFIANNQALMEIISAKEIIMLQNFLDSRNITYTMCNTMHMFDKFDLGMPSAVAQYTQHIDTTHYYKPYSNSDCFYWYYRDAGYTNESAKYWHHGVEPHELYAKALYDFYINS